MKKAKWSLLLSVILLLTALSGCSASDIEQQLMRATPTPAPEVTEVPDLVEAETGPVSAETSSEPEAPTPAPTSTPSPRKIGTKTAVSKYIFLTNSLDNAIREIYLTLYGNADWGKNMVASETTIRPGETVQMFFDEPASPKDLYNMKVVDREGNIWAIYAFELSDMDSCSIQLIGSVAFLFYTSLATGKQTNTMYGERLAKTYDYSAFTASAAEDDHEGDFNYGYYDTYGNWVKYEEGDTTYQEFDTETGDQTAGEETGPEESEPVITYYDDQYEGNPSYGYYDEYGNWTSYY